MPGFVFRLEDYPRYVQRVGEATYIDVTRRTDPARIAKVWANLRAIVDAYGPPWVLQLWTKAVRGTLARGGETLQQLVRRGTTITAQITVTGLAGTIWEPNVPIEPFAELPALMAIIGGPDHIKWRYDPIIPAVHDIERYRRLAEIAARLGIRRCVINFIAPPGRYKRVDARLCAVLPGWSAGMPGYDDGWQREVAGEIVGVARELGLQVACCAESAKLFGQVERLHPAACGDYEWFVELSGRDPGKAASSGSRAGCGCAVYFDVGLYGQWSHCHRCLYCYAG